MDLVEKGQDPLVEGSHFWNLYDPDGSHPTIQGSYLAALVIYATATGKDPRNLTYKPGNLDENDAMRLRNVAFATLEDEKTYKPTQSPTLAPTESRVDKECRLSLSMFSRVGCK